MKRKYILLIIGAAVVLLVISAYGLWNTADPVYTCARCHEIVPSYNSWTNSAHAEVSCSECHGSALSYGYRSFKEKAGMVFSHVSSDLNNLDIRMKESQVLETSERCITCHQSEYAGWISSGHAVDYKDIFMDSEHNATEKPYWDCLRCHGMFYDGNINALMDLDGKPDEWKLVDKKQESKATVPCLACHQMHTDNPVSERYVSMVDGNARISVKRFPKTSLYMRTEKKHLRTDFLTRVPMLDGEREVANAGDPNTLLCIQCHAPNYARLAGSQDDRTPIGAHEGISCTTCHQPHSGNTQLSCDQCHPAMSNCGIDVKTMNTTFIDPKSPNDIHRINCTSCHTDKNL